MNFTINPGAATDDAAQIEQIIDTIETSLQTLDDAIKNNIPSGVLTDWSDELRTNWEKYYGSDVPETMAGMKLSATNLRKAVEEALKYSKEQ